MTGVTATAPAGTYYVAVAGVNACGMGPESPETRVAVGGCQQPSVVTDLTATVVGSVVTFAWRPATGAERYRLRAGSGPGLRNLATVELGSSTNFAATAPDGTYYVVLNAVNACGTGADSNEVTARVGATSGGFSIDLPIAAEDLARESFGLNPFGIHFGGTSSGGHGLDGHPGWDVEYRIGGVVRAAADGVVQSRFADSLAPDRVTVQIQHQRPAGVFRTVYTNLVNVLASVQPGAAVAAGQPLGTAGHQSIVVGSQQQTYAMIHFQTDDFRRHEGITNPNAVNPEEFLSATAAALFATIWSTAAYNVEITEPFPGNPRNVAFPFTRTWTRQSGTHAARIAFIRREAGTSTHDYLLYDASGAVTEQGSATMQVTRTDARIDLQPAGGGLPRRGLVDIVSDTMRLDFGAPGVPRPVDLSNASTYTTSR